MTIMNVLAAPDSMLLQKSTVVDCISHEILSLIQDMFDTMHYESGLGLAAIQVGIQKRILVICIPHEYELESDCKTWCNPIALINPVILSVSNKLVKMEEGCLSLPRQRFMIERPAKISITYKNQNWEDVTLHADGWLSRCIQHEMDHLDGILFIEHLSKLKREFALKKAKKIKNSAFEDSYE